jgi:hypothetical protein
VKNIVKNISGLLPHDFCHFCYRVLRPAKCKRLRDVPKRVRKGDRASTVLIPHKGLFVHIPKCAGVAVSQGLFLERTSQHATILDYMLAYNKEEFDSLFKFTFVRNPWDRLVSAYVFLKQGGINQFDQFWSEKHLSPFDDFDDFVRSWIKKRNVEKSLHFKPQVRFLCQPRSLRTLVDFVGYFENLSSDFAAIAERLGISASLEKVNITSNKEDDYKSYYTDTTRNIVSEVYRDDIQVFGYDFDKGRTSRSCAARVPHQP